MSIISFFSSTQNMLASVDGTNFAERTSYALTTSLMGMIIVFGALAILWLVLELSRIVFYELPRRSKESENTEETPALKVVEPVPVAPVQQTSDEAVIAAITAAISVVLEQENSGVVPNFRVVSFKRVGGQTAWNSQSKF